MTHPRWRHWALGAALVMLLPIVAACGSTSAGAPTKVVKVGLVTDIGGLNDKGFNHLAYVGLQNAKHDFGIQGDVVESHSGNDYIPNLTNYATKGYDLVIGVGFLMATAIGTVSTQFPNIKFAIIDGSGTDANGNDLNNKNVESLLFHEQDAGALVGAIAGQLAKDQADPKKSNTISAVGGISIPPVNRYIAGFQWAAQMIDPGVKVLIGYSNDFVDATKCAGVANSQIAAGSDIVFQVAGGCGLGALQAAGQKGVYSIGVDTDQKTADNSVICSAVKRVDVATYTAIQQVVNSTYHSGVSSFSLENAGVGFAPGNVTLPADVVAAEAALAQQIQTNQVTPPDTIATP
ncbi:MAG TPA: BMP family ABC transporter substrate-binding protein [Ktedonobacterales bacterium]|jgi:basic membrane protein A|nr:BMP family ABC transporter substrate-binding protein [Ktedonobacterales bacterium]